MHWMHRRRLLILAAFCVFWTGLVISARFFPRVPFLANIWRSERSLQDVLCREGRKTAVNPDLMFVGIDQASLGMADTAYKGETQGNRAFQLMTERPWPWSREIWVIFMDRVFKAGARLVIFDLIFDNPNDGDPAFRKALDRYRDKVVLGANIDMAVVREGGAANVRVPNTVLVPAPQLQDDRVGYVNFFPDPLDNVIRSALYTVTSTQIAGLGIGPDETPMESMAARALEKLGLGNDIPRDLRPRLIRFSPANAYEPHALYEFFDDKAWNVNYHDGADLKDKILIVGSSAQVQHDFVTTPLTPEAHGPELHLNAMAAAMAHEFLSDTSLRVDYVCIVIAGVVALILVATVRRPSFVLIALIVIAGVYLVTVRILYDRAGLFILVIPTLSAFLLSGISGLTFGYALEVLERMRTRRTLERYVSKNLVKEILDNPDSYYHSMLGSRKPVTVLFSDLVGFTSLSEKADPVELVKQLNEYLSGMVGHVFENGGTLDKFIGDAIMAVWGNVKSQGVEQDARAAVRTALGMRDALHKLNDRWKSEGRMSLGFGVGINHGDAVIGNIGSYEPHERLDPTVIGDSVNLASRLEGLTRTYGVDVLLGASVAELVSDEFHLRSVARVQVKGKTLPVDVFTLVGPRGDGANPALIEQLKGYEEGIAQFRDHKFSEAKASFARFLQAVPGDFLAKMYLEQAIDYEKEPPPADWNAVEVFKKK
jgi:adenylate cyclase